MFLGIEIGGTKLQLGVGPGDGTLSGFWRGEVEAVADARDIRRQILDAMPRLVARTGIERASLRGVGVGFGGPVDDVSETVIKSHQIAGWDNFPLAEWLSESLDLPVAVGNDADVAGLAEALFGAGKGLSPVFYITIGSGIGGGLIINGEIYRGCGRGAAEIGHLQMIDHHVGESGCALVVEGALERFASGWAIQENADQLASDGQARGSRLLEMVEGEAQLITARHVAQAAEEGDGFALRLLEDAWDQLARAICHVIALLCPRRIVIGGGVSLMGERLLFEPIRRLVAGRVFKPFEGCYDIVPAALGEEVVVHGALALARRRLSG